MKRPLRGMQRIVEAEQGRGHERGGLLVAGEDKFDRRGPQRVDEVEVLLTGNAEDPLDALVFQRFDHDI